MSTNTTLTQLRGVKDFPSLVEYLRDSLDWQFESDDVEELTYEYEPGELGLDAGSASKIRGEIKQLRPFNDAQPWGIFYVNFDAKQLPVGALRGILRGLVAKKRASANPSGLATWKLENLLFICTSRDFQNFNFAYFRGEQTQRAVLSMFGWHRGDTHLRTLAEFNLPALRFPDDPANPEQWLAQWRRAFDVEAVTDKFFGDYKRVFEAVEAEVKKSIRQAEQARLFTQRLFNRLMFLYFIQKKGWLEFEGDKSYLRALFNAAEREGENFLRERLYWLFFYGMSNVGESREVHSHESLRERRGDVPYLNGGLFDLEDEYDERDKVEISNGAFRRIFDLFERYNFTVEESTPLDVQVAVDPEMLGKVFEELVTGRHESGSYYTPRQIVSFMCREALKHYLSGFEANIEAVARFVDEGDAEGLSDPENVLEGLKSVRVCDPACGSGAYLLGMMQELVRLRGRLFVAQHIGDDSAYKIKRSIIENNLYGVDKDQFAVQIAALRLWLSLAIDSERPQPLPNLDFKIERGDSLIAPAPTSDEKSLFFNRQQRVREYAQLKGRYMKCADGEEKRQLRARIDLLRAELAADLKHTAPRPSEQKIALMRGHAENLAKEVKRSVRAGDKTKAAKLQKDLQTINRQLAAWDEAGAERETGFDWAVEFAEVFVPEARETWRIDDLHPLLNDFRKQGTLIEESAPDEQSGGFDIVLANPPYVRMELFKPIKPILRRNFSTVHSDRADLYVYFYDRAHQLLKDGGIGAFISSNKWLRAGYGENLRQQLLDAQAFHLVIDFGELPVFKAATFPAIFVWQKEVRGTTPTTWAVVSDLQACYNEGVREHTTRIADIVPASSFGKGKPRLAASSAANVRTKMESSGQRLGELLKGQIGRGIVTGLNEAFIIDKNISDRLVNEEPVSKEVIKPLLRGDDVRHYEIHYRDLYILYMTHGIDIRRYQAVKQYLKPYKADLERRATQQEWYELQQPQAAYISFFKGAKIIYPEIGKDVRFVFDDSGYYCNNKVFILPTKDWYLLGVLNSTIAFEYLKRTCSVLGDEMKGGRLEFRAIYMETLPIPDAPSSERNKVGGLARQTQELHTSRRQLVEKFLRKCGTSPAASSSRNPLEQPWAINAQEFARRAPRVDPEVFRRAHEETAELTERTLKLEREIDERVAALYGLDSAETRQSE
jgi:type I restriction-modification system DNA methylase subunit